MFNSSKEIADLKTKIEGLETSLAQANETIAGFDGVKADLEGKLAAANDALAAEQAAHAVTKAKVTELTEQATKAAEEMEAKISAAVVERCASAGIDPIAHAGSKALGSNGDQSMSRADFNKMTAFEKSKYIREGGKLTS